MYQVAKDNKILLQKVKSYINDNYVEEEYVESEDSIAALFGVDKSLKEDFSVFKTPKSLKGLNDDLDKTWQQTVFKIIDTKEYSDPEVYKRASISKQTFSKIRSSENYQPNKDTAIQMCFGLKLNLDESIDLMAKAGYILSSSIKRDLVVRYFIQERIYSIDDMNGILEELDMKLFPIN